MSNENKQYAGALGGNRRAINAARIRGDTAQVQNLLTKRQQIRQNMPSGSSVGKASSSTKAPSSTKASSSTKVNLQPRKSSSLKRATIASEDEPFSGDDDQEEPSGALAQVAAGSVRKTKKNKNKHETMLDDNDDTTPTFGNTQRFEPRDTVDEALGFRRMDMVPHWFPAAHSHSFETPQEWEAWQKVTLPISVITPRGKYQLEASTVPRDNYLSFWDAIQEKFEEFRDRLHGADLGPLLEKDVDATKISSGAFPHLFDCYGRVKLEGTLGNGKAISRSDFKLYLESLIEGAAEMKNNLKGELNGRSKDNPLTQTEMMTKVLSTPKSYISSNDHYALIQSHQLVLSQQAELIRRDLSALVIIASRAMREAIQVRTETQELAAYSFGLLKNFIPAGWKKPTTKKVKKVVKGEDDEFDEQVGDVGDPEGGPEDQAATEVGEAPFEIPSQQAPKIQEGKQSTKDGSEGNPLALPQILIEKMLEGHICLCAECSPSFKEDQYEEAFKQATEDYCEAISVEEIAAMKEKCRNDEYEKILHDTQGTIATEVREQLEAQFTEEKRDDLLKELTDDWKISERESIKQEMSEWAERKASKKFDDLTAAWKKTERANIKSEVEAEYMRRLRGE